MPVPNLPVAIRQMAARIRACEQSENPGLAAIIALDNGSLRGGERTVPLHRLADLLRDGVGREDRPGYRKLERGARGASTALSRFLDKTVELRPGIIMPVFENDGLEVLAFMLDVGQDIIRRIGVCLNEEERRRAKGLRLERDRRRFVATRGQLRRVLASKLGISPSDVELEYGRLGKPYLSHRMPARDLRFSVSRSGDVAVIALSTRQEVGVDIEAVRPVPEADEIAALCLSASEYRSYTALDPEDRLEGFLRRWTRLEAISKALGCGLGQPVSWDERDWAVRRFVPKPGYIGSVVVRKRMVVRN